MSNLEKQDIKGSITAFDTLIADGTTNKADIGSHYNHSPERHRLYINGSRFLLQYDTTPKFEDASDEWILKPAAGDTITYETAERFRYVVGFIMQIGQTFQTNQSLQNGDKVVIGYGDADLENDMADADGWFVEFTPDLPDTQGRITEYRDGQLIDSQLARFEKPLTTWRRLLQKLNWYNVGNRVLVETFTYRGTQENERVQDSSIDNGKGPITGNHRVTFGVTAGSNTDNLELSCGSHDVLIQGNVDPIVRDKASALTGTYDQTVAGEWEPIAAARIDPSRDLVNTQLTGFQVMESTADTDVQLLALAVDPSNTDATGFATPNEHSETNSVFEVTTNVTTFPDIDGNVVGNTANPGGYQLGYSSQYTEGTGSNERRSGESRVRKRNIYNGDIAVIVAKAGTATDITFETNTEQDW